MRSAVADAREEGVVGEEPVDVARRDRRDRARRPLLVVPLHERRAVLEGRPLGRVDREGAVAAPRQIELADHERMQQADQVRTRAHHEARVGERPLERARAADLRTSLQHDDAEARPRQIGGGGEPVVTAPDDDDVPRPPCEVGDGDVGQAWIRRSRRAGGPG